MTDNNKNMITAFVLSLLVMLAWFQFYEKPLADKQRAAAILAQANKPVAAPVVNGAPGIQVAGDGSAVVAREAALTANAGRIIIKTPTLQGSINPKGARLDDMTLSRYHETLEKGSPLVDLLSPSGTAKPYFAQFGWLAARVKTPDADTLWTASATSLTPSTPVTLKWDNGSGQRFELVYEIDAEYMLTVTARVNNTSTAPLIIAPYGLIARDKPEKLANSYEGPLGTFDKFRELKYDSFKDADVEQKFESTGGWMGFSDKYWLTALIPDANTTTKSSIKTVIGTSRFQADMQWPAQTIAVGATGQTVMKLFVGAKVDETIEKYEEKNGIRLFSRAIDWGTFWWLTKPFFWVLHKLAALFGNFGLAIIGLTVLVRIVLFPIANNQMRSMNRMKIVQPKIKEIQERFKGEPEKLQKAQVELFKAEKINPLAGCLPVVLQIPVFLALYKVLNVTIDMRHQPFIGWIKDLSAPDPLTPVNLFGLLHFTPPAAIAIGVLPILYGITTWFQMKLQPQSMAIDPVQQKMFQLFPIVFTFIFASLPAGLVFYYIISNLLGIGQQKLIAKLDKSPLPDPAAAKLLPVKASKK